MTFTTLYEIVKHSVEKFSAQIAYTMLGAEDVTYEEVGRRIGHVQQLLVEAGVGAGDKVAILSSSMPNWGVSYFAVTTAGMIAVPILPDFTGEELDMIIAHSEAKAILVSDKLFAKLSKTTVERMNIVIRTKGLNVISQTVFEKGEARIPTPDDLAVIIYTSGTTSRPKGVMLSHYNICMQLTVIPPLFDFNQQDVLLSILPLSHTYECTLGMIFPFARGSRVVYLDRPPTASALMPALAEVRPTVMASVPLIMEKIYRSKVKPKFESTRLLRTLYGWGWSRRLLHRMAGRQLMRLFGGRMRLFAIGGAKFDSEAEQFLLDARFPYAIGYGLTETAPLLAGAVSDMVRVGSTGPALKGIGIRLDNVNAETGQGEIVVDTPCVMRGYYKNEEATREVFTDDGWFRTGDLGAITPDGWIYIKGRLKNMIVGPSGENIYPEDIESVINTNRFVQESIVTEQDGHLIALIHFDTDAIVKHYEELKLRLARNAELLGQKKEEIKKEIKEYVNSKVNRFSRISDVIENEEEFEKTPTRKIRRFLYEKRGKKTKTPEKK
ncbi:long-chain-fatty-acid--CoA ligase FadD15 [Alistipes sp.]|nr:long-chain-fatty-acid--CoA ligase FadD15 [Alistipes sp.]